MPKASAHPHRKLFSVVVSQGDLGRWIPLGVDCSFPPEGGKFLGFITTEGENLGKLALIDGDNTSQKVVGFAHVSVNPNYAQEGIHLRAINPMYTYPAGQEVFMFYDARSIMRIKVGKTAGGADVDPGTLIPGRAYGLKVVDGEQVLDPEAAGAGPIEVIDEITDASRGFVRVKLNSAAM